MSPIALEVDSIVDFRLVIDLKRQIRRLTPQLSHRLTGRVGCKHGATVGFAAAHWLAFI